MTIEELQERVWKQMPLAKVIVGREAVSDMVRMAMEIWPDDLLRYARSSDEALVVTKELERSILRLYEACAQGDDGKKYGMVWTIVLEAIVSSLVTLLLRWWLDSADNRRIATTWRKDLPK